VLFQFIYYNSPHITSISNVLHNYNILCKYSVYYSHFYLIRYINRYFNIVIMYIILPKYSTMIYLIWWNFLCRSLILNFYKSYTVGTYLNNPSWYKLIYMINTTVISSLCINLTWLKHFVQNIITLLFKIFY